MTESFVFEHEREKKALLRELVLAHARSHGVKEIHCPTYQCAVRWDRPNLRRHSLTFLDPLHDVAMVNEEPEKGPFSRFLRETIYIVAWDYRGKRATWFQPKKRSLRLQAPPTAQRILPDHVRVLGMTTSFSSIPIVIKRIDARLQPAINAPCIS